MIASAKKIWCSISRKILLSFVLGFVVNMHASPTIHEELEKKIASFHFEAASKLIPQLSDKKYQAYYRSNILIYKYLSTQNPKYYEEMEEVWDQAVQLVEESAAGDTLREILLSDLYGKRAVIAFLDKRYFQAIRFTRLSHKMIEASQDKYGDHIEQMKIRGLFNALLGAIPQKYQWISNTLGYKGDIDIARHQLEKAAKNSHILRQEAVFILFYVEKNMLNETEKAVARIENSRKIYGANILIDFTLASAYLNLKKSPKALSILDRRAIYKNAEVFFIPYWDYLLGKTHYYKESYAKAQVYFSQFLNTYNGKLFKSDACFRLAMSLTLAGNYESGKAFFARIAYDENGGLDEDEYAIYMSEKFLKQPPNTFEIALFRSRNLFDGGYMDKALFKLEELERQHLKFLSLAERTELYYRYGRIYHVKGEHKLALEAYRSCTWEPEGEMVWLQAYSSYYSGEIMRNRAKHNEAIAFYKKALSYKNYFYQTGLENRCKIALGTSRRELRTQTSASSR